MAQKIKVNRKKLFSNISKPNKVKEISLVDELKYYLENNSESPDEIDFGEEKIEDIKTDFLKLSKYFVLTFDNFRECFLNSNSKQINKFIDKYKIISLNIVSLGQYENSKIEYGKSEAQEELISYIKTNYYEIIDFLNLSKEVFE